MRKRGSGTYVRQVPAQVDLFSLAGTLVSFERGGIALTSRLSGRPYVHVVDDVTHPLQAREVCRVVRLSSVDRTPVLLEEIDFDAQHFPGLARLPLQGRSLSEVVEQHYRLRPQSADQSFRVTTLDAERAATLGVRNKAPCCKSTAHCISRASTTLSSRACSVARIAFRSHNACRETNMHDRGYYGEFGELICPRSWSLPSTS